MSHHKFISKCNYFICLGPSVSAVTRWTVPERYRAKKLCIAKYRTTREEGEGRRKVFDLPVECVRVNNTEGKGLAIPNRKTSLRTQC